MSGGHFDYGCFRISQFAEELQYEIDKNNDETKNEYGDTVGECLSDETLQRVIKAQKIIKTAGKLAREIEWLYSGDHGEESFCDLVDKILGGTE